MKSIISYPVCAAISVFFFLNCSILSFADIDRLLGEPIETELETSSGITHFFESVQLINTGRQIFLICTRYTAN